MTASVGTSTAIAVDRYLVVTHPLQARNPKFRAKCALCLVWAIACFFSSTQLYVGRSGSFVIDGMRRTGCAENWPSDMMRRFFSFFVLTSTYLLPLSIIAVTYGLVAWRLWRHKTPGNADNARDKLQLIAKKKVSLLSSLTLTFVLLLVYVVYVACLVYVVYVFYVVYVVYVVCLVYVVYVVYAVYVVYVVCMVYMVYVTILENNFKCLFTI